MTTSQIINGLASKLSELLAKTPAADFENHARVFLNDAFSRLDLVMREEFEIQKEVLARTRERVQILEARLAAMESAAAQSKTDKP